MVDTDKDQWKFVCGVGDCGKKFVRGDLLNRHEERHWNKKEKMENEKKYCNVACSSARIAPFISPIHTRPNYHNNSIDDHQAFSQNLGPESDPFEFQCSSSKAIVGEQTRHQRPSQVTSNASANLHPPDEHADNWENETVYASDLLRQLNSGFGNGTPSAFGVSVPSQSLQLDNEQHKPALGLLVGEQCYPSVSIVAPEICNSILKY